jgi:ribonuclease-3
MNLGGKMEYSLLEDRIAYAFSDRTLLVEALTHSSYINEKHIKHKRHNERLEFLGDSVLDLIVSDYLFHRYPNLPEGELTKVRASVVCEPTLAATAKKVDLGKFMTFGKGEDMTGGRQRPSILADAYEALIAAIYLDGGYMKAQFVVLNLMEKTLIDAVGGKVFTDFKTVFQEKIQASSQKKILYQIVDAHGPDHKKTFRAILTLDGQTVGEGVGNSKKEAQQAAAKAALVQVFLADEGQLT